jgi:hypothetical protein
MYLVLTPLPAGKTKSEIEDFFDDNVKNLKLGGKKFNANEKADSNLYFSKSILAPSWHQNGTKTRSIRAVCKPVAGIGVAESMRLSVVLLGS